MVAQKFKQMLFLLLLLKGTIIVGMNQALTLKKRFHYQDNQAKKIIYPGFPFCKLPNDLQYKIISHLDEHAQKTFFCTCAYAYCHPNNTLRKIHSIENEPTHKYHSLLYRMCANSISCYPTDLQEEHHNIPWPWSYAYSWPSKVIHLEKSQESKWCFEKSYLDLFQVCRQQNFTIKELTSTKNDLCVTPTPLIMACFTNNSAQVKQELKKIIAEFKSFGKIESAFSSAAVVDREREPELTRAFSLAMDQDHIECLNAFVSVIEEEQQIEGPKKVISELFQFPHLFLLELAIYLNKQEAFNILSQLKLNFNDYFRDSHNVFLENNKEQFIKGFIHNLRETRQMRQKERLIGGSNDEEFEEWMKEIESYDDYTKAHVIGSQFGRNLNIRNSGLCYLEWLPFLNEKRKENGWYLSTGIFEKQDAYDGKAISEQFNAAIRTNDSKLISQLIDTLEKEQFYYTGPQRCDLAQRHLSWINNAKNIGLTDICFRLILLRIQPDCSCEKRWQYPYTKEKLAKDPQFFIPKNETIEEIEKIEKLEQKIKNLEKKMSLLNTKSTDIPIQEIFAIRDILFTVRLYKNQLSQLFMLLKNQFRLTNFN